MRLSSFSLAAVAVALTLVVGGCAQHGPIQPGGVQPGDRAATLAAALPDSPLRTQLLNCEAGQFEPTDFVISHRGAPLGYPEHTAEGYQAAAAMGAGVIECDVTFTSDLELVCRHSQCDLHSTTNILQTPLAERCREPFTAATEDQPARALCCTSELTLSEFRSLCGRRDVVDRSAKSVDAYLNPPADPRTAAWRNDDVTCGTLMTHAESIALINRAGRKFTPELKAPMVGMPFQGMSQQNYADKLINEYRDAGIEPDRVFPQSFSFADVEYWIAQHPEFGRQAVYLDPRGRQPGFRPTLEGMQALKSQGVQIVAPPIPMLLQIDEQGNLAPSDYARYARQAGLEIITWTFEAGDPSSRSNWLYTGLHDYVKSEAQMLEVLDALTKQVGIRGIFSDWPGTVTYYHACQS